MELADYIEVSFLKLLKKYEASHYYLAVSGGCDSMVMLSLFQKQDKPFTVLHVNYNLRGSESDKDEALIKLYCKTKSIPFYVLNHQLSEDLEKAGNLQNLAREVRYNFFEGFIAKQKSSILCLAHHKDDQEESFWLAMARGGGLRAMAGMRIYSPPFLRPFLNHTKAELITYAREKEISWREDLSNQSNKYSRNVWRNELLPEIKSMIPQLSESVGLLQKHFEKQVDFDRKQSLSFIPSKSKDFELTTDLLSLMNSNQWIEFLDQIKIRKNLALPLLDLLNGENGKKLILDSERSDYSTVWKRKNSLYFERKAQSLSVTPVFKSYTVKSFPAEFSKKELYLDSEKIKGSLTIRLWKKGDRMCPIGMTGSKLISDILKDDKLHTSSKNKQWVLVDEEKIISLLGYRIDRRTIAKKVPCLKVVFELS